MKQKRSRDLFEKTENGSERNAPAQRENLFCPKALSENGSRVKEERLTGGGHTPETRAGRLQPPQHLQICERPPTQDLTVC